MSAASSIHANARARIGTVLKDKWQLDALLGVGGTAAVYSATHRNGKRAAIKILHPELTSTEGLVVRFLREGYVANKLEHPGAVSVLDDDRTEDGIVFLVMELLEGYSLDRHTRGNGDRLPVSQIVRIGDEVLDVLSNAHVRGVIHRDIKPANLFLTHDGKVKVLDFGIARLRDGSSDAAATQTGSMIGTPAYMPPEQARGRWQSVDARTDIWAVGATLFALLAGQRPRRAETVNEELLLAMTEPMPKVLAFAPHVPPQIASIVDRALEFEMDGRFRDARTMQLALRQAVGTLGEGLDAPTMVTAVLGPTAPARSVDPASTPSAQPAPALQSSSRSWPQEPQPPMQNTPIAGGPMTSPMPRAVVDGAGFDPAQPDLDPRFTTSRPIQTDAAPLVAQPVKRSSRGGAAIVLALLGAVLVLAAGGATAVVKMRSAKSSATSAPLPTMSLPMTTAPTTTPATATTTTTTTTTTTAPTTTATTTPTTATTTATPTSSSTAAPASSSPSPRAVARPSASGRPSPSTTAGNPWDQRF